MAGIGDILKTVLYGFAVWKKVGEPVYTTYKESSNIKKRVENSEKELLKKGIVISSLHDRTYFESLSQEQKDAVCQHFETEGYLQWKLGETQEKFYSHFSQPGEMQYAEYQLQSSGIDLGSINDRAYLDSLTLKQKEMINAYRRMKLRYLKADQQEDFNNTAVRLNRIFREISEEKSGN